MKVCKRLVVLTMLMGVVYFAHATTGKADMPVLHGYVTDAVTKKPVAGVIVSALLPGNTNNIVTREATTDAEGYFHFVQLPTAPIILQFDKKGYQLYKRTGILVKDKSTLKVNVEFLPDDIEDNGGHSDPIVRMIQLY